MLLNPERSCLVLVDVQEKLAPRVCNSQAVIERCAWLIRLADELRIKQLVSEQYPQGLGATVAPLRPQFSTTPCIEKVHFSCQREPKFKEQLELTHCNQVILIGIETHVCVLQTAIDLKAVGYEVYVVVDAVSSRKELDHRYGLKRMKQAGVELVTAEMVFFEWIGQAGTPQFKALSKAYLQ